jgi:hypothetical protein
MTIVARPVIAWSSARCRWRIPTALTHAVCAQYAPDHADHTGTPRVQRCSRTTAASTPANVLGRNTALGIWAAGEPLHGGLRLQQRSGEIGTRSGTHCVRRNRATARVHAPQAVCVHSRAGSARACTTASLSASSADVASSSSRICAPQRRLARSPSQTRPRPNYSTPSAVGPRAERLPPSAA